MNYHFNVNLTDQDYLDYNLFWNLRSPYSKKQMKFTRIIFAVVFGLFAITSLIIDGISADSIIVAVFWLLVLLVFQLLLPSYIKLVLKGHIASLKKRGRMAYSPVSTLEFNEDNFIETTPNNKTEQSFASVERISIVDNKNIYFHVNNIASYILPLSCFGSKEQYDSFFAFIKTKCSNIDIYNK